MPEPQLKISTKRTLDCVTDVIQDRFVGNHAANMGQMRRRVTDVAANAEAAGGFGMSSQVDLIGLL